MTGGDLASVPRTPLLSRELWQLTSREWLETNGLGSYASSTACGADTRRYHGLFVAALDPPARRCVLLARVEETVRVGDGELPLSTNFYPGVVHPEGYRAIASFEPRPVPTWHFSANGLELERRVWMLQGRQGVAICYRLLRARGPESVELRVRPLAAFRSFHALTAENPDLDPSTVTGRGWISIQPYAALPPLYLHHGGARFVPEPLWYRSFEYPAELERGFPGHEDLFSHGAFTFTLGNGAREAFLFASLDRIDGLTLEELRALEELEVSRRRDRAAWSSRARATGRPGPARSATAPPTPLDRWADTFATRLAEAAEQFLVSRADGARTVVAGYHWFEDWGRDTFIALPGLALATGRWPLTYELLRTFAGHIDGGMLPNRFPDAGTSPEYNTVDAALWFVEAARRYAQDTGDLSFVDRELLPRIEEILAHYTQGTRFGIAVDAGDGLLTAGAEGVALTWMDAIVDGKPVTPRRGKCVEINALWHNALSSAVDLAEALGRVEQAEGWRREAARVRESFNKRFRAPDGWLFDVVDGPGGDDASLRPNQIFAISLPHAPLRADLRRTVVDVVEQRLLTPMGLRTLDPADPRYRGRCEGSPAERDTAYHNGTVWPWLVGPFATAYLKTHGRTPEAFARVRALVQPFAKHLGGEGCIGQISEIADGDPPHTPRGCVAQAWSVAELARVLLERPR